MKDTENEIKQLKRKISEAQDTVDALLLKAAQTDNELSNGFMRLADQRQTETTLLQKRFEQIKSGLHEDTDKPVKILELAQHLSKQYVTLEPPQKR